VYVKAENLQVKSMKGIVAFGYSESVKSDYGKFSIFNPGPPSSPDRMEVVEGDLE